MISSTHRNIIYGLALIGIVIILIMPDVVMDYCLSQSISSLRSCLKWLMLRSSGLRPYWIRLSNTYSTLNCTKLRPLSSMCWWASLRTRLLSLAHADSPFFPAKRNSACSMTLNKARATLYWQGLSLNDIIKLIVITAGAIYWLFFIHVIYIADTPLAIGNNKKPAIKAGSCFGNSLRLKELPVWQR